MMKVPLAQRIARWTSNPKVLGSIPRWDDLFLRLFQYSAFKVYHIINLDMCFRGVAVITSA